MSLRVWLSACLLLLTLSVAQAAEQEGYPAEYASTVAAARREGQVVIYASTDEGAARPLIDDFRALYPGIAVHYHEIDSMGIYQRFLRESREGMHGADVLWSSAMDLQMKLVNDGHALVYASPQRHALPGWAVWRNEAYGTTLEPVGFAYNKKLLAESEVPRTHADFIRLLRAQPQRLHGRVATYDLERSGLGFLVATQDARASGMLWEVGREMGRLKARQMTSTAAMLDSIAAGESLLAYNVLGSYASEKMRANPLIGVVYPSDYTLVGSRIAFIHRRAAHPNAARLWLDYLLSRRGQSLLASQSGLIALRSGIQGEHTAAALQREAAGNLRPIGIGPSLIVYLDRQKRENFLRRWQQALPPPSGEPQKR
ncbi:MAG: ABC transporter substrate-binding protein [Proteobacteria bacterium]|nr:ABC transporter substrate-binding protein [Pseudomonadota bacterium]MBS0495265.1 ABC transporter substrate-binding protein [Pseudomonadota bacterium]